MCAIHENAGLTELVSVVWCLLLLGPYGMSAPAGRDGWKKDFWIDPCGGHPVEGPGGERRTDAELLDAIMMTATRALNKAKSFADAYVNDIPLHKLQVDADETWSRTMEGLNKDFPARVLTPEKNPKHLGEKVPAEHLHTMSQNPLGQNLVKHYGHLQELAIELQRVVENLKNERDKFSDEFESLMHHLKQVLCEVLTGISELGYVDDVDNRTRPVRADPPLDKTFQLVRNFQVFREFIIYMEYLIEGCKFFKERFQMEG